MRLPACSDSRASSVIVKAFDSRFEGTSVSLTGAGQAGPE